MVFSSCYVWKSTGTLLSGAAPRSGPSFESARCVPARRDRDLSTGMAGVGEPPHGTWGTQWRPRNLEMIGIYWNRLYIYTRDNIWVMIWDNSLIDITECVKIIPWPDQTHGYLRTWARRPTCPPLNQPREVPKSLFGKSTILSPTTSTRLQT